MTHGHGIRRAVLALVATVLGLTGCAVTDPTRYYVLVGADGIGPGHVESGSGITVGVGPVMIPGYLDRVQIVTRSSGDQVQIWPYHRWAEPLDMGIARTLSDDLAARIPTERVLAFPWRGSGQAIEYQVVVAVLRFDGQPGVGVMLDARWRLLGNDGRELVFKRTTLTEATGGPGYEALVAAMSRALGGLGQEIATEIRAQSAKRAATGS